MVAKKAIDAVSLKANAVLAQCSAVAIGLMQGLIDSGEEAITLQDQIEQGKADLGQCQDFGFTAVRDMFIGQSNGETFAPMSFELIYDLYDVMTQGEAKSNVLKSAKSALQTAHTFGLTITPTTSKGECLAHTKKHKAAAIAKAESKASDMVQGDNEKGINITGDRLKGELSDAAVCKQAYGLHFSDVAIRNANRENFDRLAKMYKADDAKAAKIAADKKATAIAKAETDKAAKAAKIQALEAARAANKKELAESIVKAANYKAAQVAQAAQADLIQRQISKKSA